jgi:hypothetical protein
MTLACGKQKGLIQQSGNTISVHKSLYEKEIYE